MPPPGSVKARNQGCCCAVIDNHHGFGELVNGKEVRWYVRDDCMVHGDGKWWKCLDGTGNPK